MMISTGNSRMRLQNLVKGDIVRVDRYDSGFLKLDRGKIGENVMDSGSEIFKVAGVFPSNVRLVAVKEASWDSSGKWVTVPKARPFSICTNCEARVELVLQVERPAVEAPLEDEESPIEAMQTSKTSSDKSSWEIETFTFNDYDNVIRHLLKIGATISERNKAEMCIIANMSVSEKDSVFDLPNMDEIILIYPAR